MANWNLVIPSPFGCAFQVWKSLQLGFRMVAIKSNLSSNGVVADVSPFHYGSFHCYAILDFTVNKLKFIKDTENLWKSERNFLCRSTYATWCYLKIHFTLADRIWSRPSPILSADSTLRPFQLVALKKREKAQPFILLVLSNWLINSFTTIARIVHHIAI